MSQSGWAADIHNVFPDWETDSAAQRWPEIRQSITVGQAVNGRVISRAPFGVWLDIGVNQPALLLVVNMEWANTKRITFEDFPEIGTVLTALKNALGDRGEIGLTQHLLDRMIES